MLKSTGVTAFLPKWRNERESVQQLWQVVLHLNTC